MKKKFIYGMFAIILGIGLSAGNVSATSYDPTGLPGNPPQAFAAGNALINNHGMVGDALLGELVRAVTDDTIGGVGPVEFATYVSIENTTDSWVAAHVRLRTGRYSVEVIDFPILLSPHDVFWFQFEAVPSGVVGVPSAIKIVSRDRDTILKSGLDGLGVWNDPELTMMLDTSLLDDFDRLKAEYKEVKELTQGYIEVFGMFSLTFTGTNSVNANHNFFDVMTQLWDSRRPRGPSYVSAPGARAVLAADVGKALTGHVFIGDFTNGLYTGYTMKAIKDFRSPTVRVPGAPALTDRRDWFARGTRRNGGLVNIPPGVILYSGINDAAYRDPDWATSFGPTWNDGDNPIGALPLSAVDSFSLDEVEDALVKETLLGTYFNSGFSLETYTIAVVTAPTKYLHYFFAEERPGVRSGLAGTGWVQWPVGNSGDANVLRGLINIERSVGTLAIQGAVWNQEQESPVSPSPYVATDLDWELNLIPMGQGTYAKLGDFCFLVSTDTQSPFYTGITIADYPAGYWSMSQFQLSGILQDPRNTIAAAPVLVQGYNRANFPLLNRLAVNQGLGRILPVSGQILDFDFTNFPHARTIDPSWDNPAW